MEFILVFSGAMKNLSKINKIKKNRLWNIWHLKAEHTLSEGKNEISIWSGWRPEDKMLTLLAYECLCISF